MMYSGAGVLPITKFNGVDCFIVFSSKRDRFSDAGGKVDGNESIEESGIRELYEESCKLFRISLAEIKKHTLIDIPCGMTKYGVFILKVNCDVSKDDYHLNRQILLEQNAHYHYLETFDMTFLPTNQIPIRIPGDKKLYEVEDVYGNKKTITRRLYKIIKEFDAIKMSVKELTLNGSYNKSGGITWSDRL